MVLVFGVEGFTPETRWPIFLFLFCLYLHAVVIGFGHYEPQAAVLCGLYLTVFVVALQSQIFEHPFIWAEITITTSIVIIFLLRNLGSIRTASLSLLACAWIYGETRIRGIVPEPDLARALHIAWLSASGVKTLGGVMPSVVTLLETRFYWIFLASAVVAGVHARWREIAAIRLLKLFSVRRWKVKLHKLALRPIGRVSTGPFSAIIAVSSWIFSYIAYAFLQFCFYLWFVVGNGFGIVLYSVLWSSLQIIRIGLYLGNLLLQVIWGVLRACWLSFLAILIAVAVSCLDILLPLLLGVGAIHEFELTATVVSHIVHQQLWSPFEAAMHALGCISLFSLGMCVAVWSLSPENVGMAWWRDAMTRGLGLSLDAWRHFEIVFAANMNYWRNICVRLLPAYFFALLGFDVLGRFIGGPYQFGYLFLICILLLVGTFVVNVALGRDAWRIVRK